MCYGEKDLIYTYVKLHVVSMKKGENGGNKLAKALISIYKS